MRLQTKLKILIIFPAILLLTQYSLFSKQAPKEQSSKNLPASEITKDKSIDNLPDLPPHSSKPTNEKSPTPNNPNPESEVTFPKNMTKISGRLTVISGTAKEESNEGSNGGSEVGKVQISLYDATNNLYFKGIKDGDHQWSLEEIWIDTEGTENWKYTLPLPILKLYHIFEVKSKAIDKKGKEENLKGRDKKGITFTIVP